jgi:hypothetical protein
MDVNTKGSEYIQAEPFYQRVVERDPNFTHPVYDPTYKAMTHDKVYKDAGKEPFDYPVWPEASQGIAVVDITDRTNEGKAFTDFNEYLTERKEKYEGSEKSHVEHSDCVKEKREKQEAEKVEYILSEGKAPLNFEDFMISEKAKSQAQQRLMGQAYAYKKGKLKPRHMDKEYRDTIIKLAQEA